MRKGNAIWWCLASSLVIVAVLGWGARRLRGRAPGVPTHTVQLSVHEDVDPADDSVVQEGLPPRSGPAFLDTLVDSRPLGGWQVNSSAAVLRLDSRAANVNTDPSRLTVYPTYAAAVRATASPGPTANREALVPSIDLVDAKAKQFDDGLYAALDADWFTGGGVNSTSPVELVRRIYQGLPAQSPAAPFLAASLELAGQKVAVADEAAKNRWVADFLREPAQSRPIGFYTWNETLQQDFRFSRFLQTPLRAPPGTDPGSAVARDIARVLESNPTAMTDYRKSIAFFAGLTNPPACRTIADLCRPSSSPVGPATRTGGEGVGMGSPDKVVAFFPPSRSKESQLFERLYAFGMPSNANLMRDLIANIRSGKVDLAPSAQSGWYDYQVYALESLLLPERGTESQKLVLTRDYRLRLLQAFKAMITTRRETHVKMLPPGSPGCPAPPAPPLIIQPRLRAEPNPTYYLRVARSYAFLTGFLDSTVGPATMSRLHGLTEDGQRDAALTTELCAMRDLFYGMYFISMEDIGMRPQLLPGEPVEERTCREAALAWLATAAEDPDLARDARVALPIFFEDQARTRLKLWLVMGVRLAPFHAAYVPGRGPSIRHLNSAGPWQSPDPDTLTAQQGLIPVGEFAEVTIGRTPPTRDDLRSICDSCQTTDEILAALRKLQPQ